MVTWQRNLQPPKIMQRLAPSGHFRPDSSSFPTIPFWGPAMLPMMAGMKHNPKCFASILDQPSSSNAQGKGGAKGQSKSLLCNCNVHRYYTVNYKLRMTDIQLKASYFESSKLIFQDVSLYNLYVSNLHNCIFN